MKDRTTQYHFMETRYSDFLLVTRFEQLTKKSINRTRIEDTQRYNKLRHYLLPSANQKVGQNRCNGANLTNSYL